MFFFQFIYRVKELGGVGEGSGKIKLHFYFGCKKNLVLDEVKCTVGFFPVRAVLVLKRDWDKW